MAIVNADLHTHLLEKGERPERYWGAVKTKGLDAVAITEHADKRPERAYKALLESRSKAVVLVPGIELNTSIGHVLAFGRDEGIYSIERLYRKKLPIGEAVEIAKREGLVLSVAHPWGFSYDSAAFIAGEKRLERLVKGKGLGVEAYNGMFGNASSYFYSSSWIKKPMNFFDFLEKSRLGRKTRLSRLGKRARSKLDRKGRELIERCTKPMELGEKAGFVTAGSDAHSADRIGAGIMKVKVRGKVNAGKLLEAVQEKGNVMWAGPYVRETKQGNFVADKASLGKKELLQGLRYATKRAIVKRIRRKRKKGFKGKLS